MSSPVKRPAWIVAFTITDGITLTDQWRVVATRKEALEHYSALILADTVYCATYGQMKDGTEPHWMTGDV